MDELIQEQSITSLPEDENAETNEKTKRLREGYRIYEEAMSKFMEIGEQITELCDNPKSKTEEIENLKNKKRDLLEKLNGFHETGNIELLK